VSASAVAAPADAVLADFDDDHRADIVAVSLDQGLTLQRGLGKGKYAPAVPLAAGQIQGNRILTADFDSDGRADVLAYADGGRYIWVVLSDGAGGVKDVRTVLAPGAIYGLAVADYDRNGAQDFAVVAAGLEGIFLAENRDNLSGFDSRVVSIRAHPISVGTVEMYRDAYSDLVIGAADGTVRLLRNIAGSFVEAESRKVDFTPAVLATGDLDLDGYADVLAASRAGRFASIPVRPFEFGQPIEADSGQPLQRVSIGRVNGDEFVDVVAVTAEGAVVLCPARAAFQFDLAVGATSTGNATSVSLVPGARAPQCDLLVSRPGGISFEPLLPEQTKLRRTATVTNTLDDPLLPPAGSLRAAIATGGTISFDISTEDAGFDDGLLVWVITLGGDIEVPVPGTQILGETQLDTNDFGPEIVIAAGSLLHDGTAASPGLGANDAKGFVVTGGSCRISSVIMVGFDDELPEVRDMMGGLIANASEGAAISLQSNGNTILGCYIGVGHDGTVGSPISERNFHGIELVLGASANVIGVDAPIDDPGGNVIGGNDFDGIRIELGSGNVVEGNRVGVGRDDSSAPNNRGVTTIDADLTEVANNVLSGNGVEGLLLTGATTNSDVHDNIVGATSTADNGRGNGIGIGVTGSSANDIGPANIVGANGDGIYLGATEVKTTGTLIANNQIGGADLANTGHGVNVDNADLNSIGPGNLIALNRGDGVFVNDLNVQNTITMNSITLNGELGIDLFGLADTPPGVTPNDAGDVDSGANNLLNFPVFTTLDVSSGAIVVSGTAPAGSVVEIFQSDNDDSGFGQGATYIMSVTTTAGGTFTATLPFGLPVADNTSVTATATLAGNTSEFSANFNLNRQLTVTPSTINFGTVTVGSNVSQVVTLCNVGASDLTIQSVVLNPAGAPFSVTSVPADGQVLSPNECTTVTVSYMPTALIASTTSLVITSNDVDTPVINVPVSGNAVEAVVEFGITSLSIPVTDFGATRAASVVVTNRSLAPLNVTNVLFRRRISGAKITWTSTDLDPFFSVDDSTFTLGVNESRNITIFFTPQLPNVADKSGLKTAPYSLPDPSFMAPENIKTRMTLEVNGGEVTGGFASSVTIRARVTDAPHLLPGGFGTVFTDSGRANLTVPSVDPDANFANASWVFYDDQDFPLLRIDNTPTIAEKTDKFFGGIGIPIRFKFSGLGNSTPYIDYVTVFITDAEGQQTELGVFVVIDGKIGPMVQRKPGRPVDNRVPRYSSDNVRVEVEQE
jgi:hypothetical protein